MVMTESEHEAASLARVHENAEHQRWRGALAAWSAFVRLYAVRPTASLSAAQPRKTL